MRIHTSNRAGKSGSASLRYRAQRKRSRIPTVALLGYTNAGKSTLLNRLAKADVYVANQLFATLDPTTRRVQLPGDELALITDTVGIYSKTSHRSYCRIPCHARRDRRSRPASAHGGYFPPERAGTIPSCA
jgi:GTPase involved in cell partitioning and DNA repair